ncbi:hypothetical protein PT2222_40324 [Paraburkholderia tropica]
MGKRVLCVVCLVSCWPAGGARWLFNARRGCLADASCAWCVSPVSRVCLFWRFVRPGFTATFAARHWPGRASRGGAGCHNAGLARRRGLRARTARRPCSTHCNQLQTRRSVT